MICIFVAANRPQLSELRLPLYILLAEGRHRNIPDEDEISGAMCSYRTSPRRIYRGSGPQLKKLKLRLQLAATFR